MVSCDYPPCPKCSKGYLLPFYNERGANIYLCTVCDYRMGFKAMGGHKGVDDRSYEPDHMTSFIWEMEKIEQEAKLEKERKQLEAKAEWEKREKEALKEKERKDEEVRAEKEKKAREAKVDKLKKDEEAKEERELRRKAQKAQHDRGIFKIK